MGAKTTYISSEAIRYIEENLSQKLELGMIADALHYSKFHLHRSFAKTVGLTLHDYIRRRQMTEAARLLAFSKEPILQIALTSGYESQQAFTDAFKAMYKAAGVMAFSDSGNIDFLAMHPQYRNAGITKLFLDKLTGELLCGREISITTYRAGDKADTGYREIWGSLGFAEAELLVEFGYPTQRFILHREKSEDKENE